MAGVKRAELETDVAGEGFVAGCGEKGDDPLALLFDGEGRRVDGEDTMPSDEHLHQLWLVLGLDDD